MLPGHNPDSRDTPWNWSLHSASVQGLAWDTMNCVVSLPKSHHCSQNTTGQPESAPVSRVAILRKRLVGTRLGFTPDLLFVTWILERALNSLSLCKAAGHTHPAGPKETVQGGCSATRNSEVLLQ